MLLLLDKLSFSFLGIIFLETEFPMYVKYGISADIQISNSENFGYS